LRIIIVGAGKLGYDLTKILSQEDHDVIVIDKDAEALKPIADNFDVMTVNGNGASVKVLEKVQADTAQLVLAVTDYDELNIIACMIAKQWGVPMTVARVRNPDYAPDSLPFLGSYHNFGIDLFLNPEYLAAQEIYRLIEVPNATSVGYFADGKLSLISLKISENMAIAGKRIYELNLDKITVVAIIRQGNVLIPNGSTQLLMNDKVFVMGRTEGFHNLNPLMKLKNPRFKRIVIAGGGLITEFLVRELNAKRNVPEIKVIEPSLERCRVLPRGLEGCSIIHADPTRLEILEEENLGAGDIFISLTGSDNSNLVACMVAKQLQVSQILCEVSREDYISLAETIGVTATVTPRMLTVSSVLKAIKKKNVIAVSLLNTGEAEILELEVEPDAPATHLPLKHLEIPVGIVIGAVLHNGEVVIPRGDTRIMAGDRVIVFSLRSLAAEVEKLFRQSETFEDDGTH